MENGSVQNQLNNSNMQINDYTCKAIFLRDNKYESGNYTNDTYVDETLEAGTLMGQVSATLELIPLASGASDGSQLPYGILTKDVTVAAGDTVAINVCVAGEVASDMVVLDGTDTLDTLIDGRTIRARIMADTVGIKLVAGTELTAADNS